MYIIMFSISLLYSIRSHNFENKLLSLSLSLSLMEMVSQWCKERRNNSIWRVEPTRTVVFLLIRSAIFLLLMCRLILKPLAATGIAVKRYLLKH